MTPMFTDAISSWLRATYRISCVFGFDPRKTLVGIRSIPRFLLEYLTYNKSNRERTLNVSLRYLYRVDGFISHLLVFMDVEVIDIWPLKSALPELHFIQDDATELCQLADNSIESLSSLHAAEHLGLGQYGDPINPDAYRTFIAALVRVLAPGGRLYFAVPVGKERLEFNAHRIFYSGTDFEPI